MLKIRRKAIQTSVVMGAAGVFWFASGLLMPEWLYWGMWAFYLAGGLSWMVFVQRDIRRMERESLKLVKENTEAILTLQPILDGVVASMSRVQADRTELWRQVMGPNVPMPSERAKVN